MGQECGDGAFGQECGDGRVRMSVETGKIFLLGIYFQNSPTIFYLVIYFRIIVSSYYSIFLSWLRKVGEGNDFFGCGQAWGRVQFFI